MSDKFFIDTNILIYFYTSTEESRRNTLEKLLNDATLVISTQVLNEFTNVLLKKFKIPHDEIASLLNELSKWCSVYVVQLPTIIHTLHVIHKYKISYFDGLMVAAALECDCNIMYSEDLHHGLIVEGSLQIINPFKTTSGI